jgi:hypothetical protein
VNKYCPLWREEIWPISPTFYKRFYAKILALKIVPNKNVSTKKLCAKLSYEKAVHKMLVKLTHGKQTTTTTICKSKSKSKWSVKEDGG